MLSVENHQILKVSASITDKTYSISHCRLTKLRIGKSY